MKTKCIWIFMSFCVGIFSSCKSVSVFKVQDLSGKWTIVSVKDENVELQNMPFLEFDVAAKRVHGNAGCNMLNAGFETDAKDATAIKFIAPVTTMMACIQGMETEAKILQAINAVTNVQKGNNPNQVKLLDKAGNTLIGLNKP